MLLVLAYGPQAAQAKLYSPCTYLLCVLYCTHWSLHAAQAKLDELMASADEAVATLTADYQDDLVKISKAEQHACTLHMHDTHRHMPPALVLAQPRHQHTLTVPARPS